MQRLLSDRGKRTVERHADVTHALPPGFRSVISGGASYDGSALMQQQCWLWERDCERVGGNLLIDYGFECSTPPRREWGAPCYEFTLDNGGRLRLWPFGIMYCDPDDGAVFLERSQFVPKLVPAQHALLPVWRPDQILLARTPRVPADKKKLLQVMPPLLAWIGSYEQWVLDTIGSDYRRECIASHTTPLCDPEKLPVEWWSAAAKWREYLA